MADKNVLIIGGGVAGLSAAVELANLGVQVELVEKSDFLGGHAIGYACKAINNTCVKCGACMVEEKLQSAVFHPNIKMLTGSHVQKISKNHRFTASIRQEPLVIDPEKCTHCGLCLDRCPADGAVCQGFSKNNIPFYAVSPPKCLYFNDRSCTICKDECPETAIDLDKKASEHAIEADAVLIATGFKPFNPADKPYGYGRFKNVVTGLDLERMIKRTGCVMTPSDNKTPERIAFIQCVGSRDSRLNHLWCSKVCCGSALRMSRLIRERHPETGITFFYMDVQTFGKDFEPFYEEAQKEIRMIRAIPGDIYETDGQRLKVNFVNNSTHETMEEIFDMVVLSVGITPCEDIGAMSRMFKIGPDEFGFLETDDKGISVSKSGVFTAGTVRGPMSIPDTIAGAGSAAWKIAKYLGLKFS
ncbi:MAG: CoB--CoM heterodisulfide reductase iron-sulfur subunit A family protein [Deltaproteobacteria bacterium]|nr:CoB--CoM heterodisulfide reductase iron-sulfur subunit A family protein [Deltaproteobacteria bacterium]